MRQQISGFQKPKFWLDTAIQKFKWKNNMILLVGAGYMAQNHAKVLSALGKEYIVVGRGEETAQKFGIRSIPTMIIFKEGKDVETLMGNLPKEEILGKLNAQL